MLGLRIWLESALRSWLKSTRQPFVRRVVVNRDVVIGVGVGEACLRVHLDLILQIVCGDVVFGFTVVAAGLHGIVVEEVEVRGRLCSELLILKRHLQGGFLALISKLPHHRLQFHTIGSRSVGVWAVSFGLNGRLFQYLVDRYGLLGV